MPEPDKSIDSTNLKAAVIVPAGGSPALGTGASPGTGAAPGTGWLVVRGLADPDLQARLALRAAERQKSHGFTADNVQYLSKLDLRLLTSDRRLSDRRLELLRSVCSSWYVDLKDQRISSHRRIIGPMVVFAKRILFRIIRVLMNELLKDQRKFNASVIALLADLSASHSGVEGNASATQAVTSHSVDVSGATQPESK